MWNKMSQSLILEFKYWTEKIAEVSHIFFVAQTRIINSHKTQGPLPTAALQVENQWTLQEIGFQLFYLKH